MNLRYHLWVFMVVLFANQSQAASLVLGKGSSAGYSRACRITKLQAQEAQEGAVLDAKTQCRSDVEKKSDWEFSGTPGCWDEGIIYAQAYFSCVGVPTEQ